MYEELITVAIAVVTAITSSKAWDFWNRKQTLAEKKEKESKEDKNLYRDELREEVKILRKELIDSYSKREEEFSKLQTEISDLKEELASFKTRVEFLEKENSELKKRLEKNT